MRNIKEKIAGLLALATSPEEDEAEVALPKARELMAKHKLKPKDSGERKSARIVLENVNVTCTKQIGAWAITLANIIAQRHCCQPFWSSAPRFKTSQVGFVGFEDDFELCKNIYISMRMRVSRPSANRSRRCIGIWDTPAARFRRCATPLAWVLQGPESGL